MPYDPRTLPQVPIVRQFTKFALVGVVNTATSFSIYFILTRFAGLSVAAANPIAFALAVSVSFLLNRRWTFRVTTGDHRMQYAKFFAVNVVGLLVNQGIIVWLHYGLHLHDIVAWFGAVVVVMFWKFYANRHWTFAVHVNG